MIKSYSLRRPIIIQFAQLSKARQYYLLIISYKIKTQNNEHPLHKNIQIQTYSVPILRG